MTFREADDPVCDFELIVRFRIRCEVRDETSSLDRRYKVWLPIGFCLRHGHIFPAFSHEQTDEEGTGNLTRQ